MQFTPTGQSATAHNSSPLSPQGVSCALSQSSALVKNRPFRWRPCVFPAPWRASSFPVLTSGYDFTCLANQYVCSKYILAATRSTSMLACDKSNSSRRLITAAETELGRISRTHARVVCGQAHDQLIIRRQRRRRNRKHLHLMKIGKRGQKERK